ncbi:MAG: gliding motility-associated protein GldE [Rikenellaceae bacterium]|jgi:gliding motility-associated protein GldE|nr:gliding motility-associated protein GldE [Rikenellaceae bacterium]
MYLLNAIITFNGFSTQAAASLVIVVALLTLSAFVSGSETAFFSLTPSDLGRIKRSQSRRDDKVLRVLANQEYLLATVLVVNNLVNIGVVILSNGIINSLFTFGHGAWEFVIKVIVVTFMLLLFGEIVPKIFAANNAVRYATFAAVPLLVLKRLFKPLSFILIRTTSPISNSNVASRRGGLSIGELSEAIDITDGQSDEEREMLSGIVDFVNTEVEQVMRQRLDIVAINIDEGFEAVKRRVVESGHSRIPIYEQSLDNIRGVLYVKDILAFVGEGDAFRWQEKLRKPYFIPEHKKINDLMVEFKKNKIHLAIVVDEYGSTVGLVSLEDILEEVVGEILDESDREESSLYTRLDDNTFIFDGKCHINGLTEVAGLDEDIFDAVRGEAETVAGLMLELRRDFLHKGESVSTAGVRFTALSTVGRRIDRIKVEITR